MPPVLSVTPTFVMSPDLPILPTATAAFPSLAILPTFIMFPDLPIMPTAVFPALVPTRSPSSAPAPAATPSVFDDGFKGPPKINILFFAFLFGTLIMGTVLVAAALRWNRLNVRKAKNAALKDEEAQVDSSGGIESQTQAEISIGAKVLDDDCKKLSNVCAANYTDDVLENKPVDEDEDENLESSYDSKRFTTILAGLDISFSDTKDSDDDIRNSAASLFSENDHMSIISLASDSKRLSGSNWAAVQGVVSQRASFVRSATYIVEESGSHAFGFQAEIVHDIGACAGQPLQSIPEADITDEGSAHMRADNEYIIAGMESPKVEIDAVGDLFPPTAKAMTSATSTIHPLNPTTGLGEKAMLQLDKLIASLREVKKEDFVLTFDDGESFNFPLPPMHIPTMDNAPAAGSTPPRFSSARLEATQTSLSLHSENPQPLDVNNTLSPSVAQNLERETTFSLVQDDTISTTEAGSGLDRPLSMDFTLNLNPNPPQKSAADFEAYCRERDAAHAATTAELHLNDHDCNFEDVVSTCASDYSITALSEGQTEGKLPPLPSPFITDAIELIDHEQLMGFGQAGVPSTRYKPSSYHDDTKVDSFPANTEPDRIIPAIWQQSHTSELPKASIPKHIPRSIMSTRKNTVKKPNGPVTGLHPETNKVPVSTQGTVKAESKSVLPLEVSRSSTLVAPRTSSGNVEPCTRQGDGRAVPAGGDVLARQTLGGRPKSGLPSVQSSTVRVGPNPCTPRRTSLATTLVRGGAGTKSLISKTITSVPDSPAIRALKSADINSMTKPANSRGTLAAKNSSASASASATIRKAKFFSNLVTPSRQTLNGDQNVTADRAESVLRKVSSSLPKPELTRQRKRDWTN